MTDSMCRNCRLYDIDNVKDKAGRVRAGRSAKCRWEFPIGAWPDSIYPEDRHLTKRFMLPNDGAWCAAFEERKDG